MDARRITRIQAALTTISRRGSARIRRSNQALSPVDHSLLFYLRSNPRCRAVDIASHFGLNRSTVSRQLAALIELGLLEASADGGAITRSQQLQLTASGEKVLEESASLINGALTERLRKWSKSDIQAFAAMLDRFNRDMDDD